MIKNYIYLIVRLSIKYIVYFLELQVIFALLIGRMIHHISELCQVLINYYIVMYKQKN